MLSQMPDYWCRQSDSQGCGNVNQATRLGIVEHLLEQAGLRVVQAQQ